MDSSTETPQPEWRASSSELLCVPFLDTDTSKDTERANSILLARGYPLWLIKLLRQVFAVGLWTQVFVWEEWHLDIADVLAGYGLLLIPLGLFLLWVGYVSQTFLASVGGAILALGPLLVVFGFWLMWRRGKKWREEAEKVEEKKP
jgi:hypothetical protein